MATRWGIVTTGKIASDFTNALKGLPKEEHVVVAVSARSLESAKEFAKAHNIPKFYEGQTAIGQDPDVQVVYIGALNNYHYEIAKELLQNGKHILCEKPFMMNQKQAKEIIELARSKKLFLMEAIWSRFFPVYREIDQLIRQGAVGDIRHASVHFGFPINNVERVVDKKLGGSAVLDLGVYALQFQQFIFRDIKPLKIIATGHLSDNDVDLNASVVFKYPGNKLATVGCDACLELPNEAVIAGTKGIIRIPQFWAPTSYTLNGQKVEKPLIPNDNEFNYTNSAGLAYEAQEVREMILKGKIESEIVTHDNMLELAGWEDFIRTEIGVVDLE